MHKSKLNSAANSWVYNCHIQGALVIREKSKKEPAVEEEALDLLSSSPNTNVEGNKDHPFAWSLPQHPRFFF